MVSDDVNVFSDMVHRLISHEVSQDQANLALRNHDAARSRILQEQRLARSPLRLLLVTRDASPGTGCPKQIDLLVSQFWSMFRRGPKRSPVFLGPLGN